VIGKKIEQRKDEKMNITIINGIQDSKENSFQNELELTVDKLNIEHTVDLFTVVDMDINYCCGCFGCWVKTPGRCIFNDEMIKVYKSMVKTDYLLFISPLVKGFISSDAKRAMDRIIPILLPYIDFFDGESHHVPRYEKRSKLGIVLIGEDDMDVKAVEIVYDTFDRFSKNYHALNTFKATAKSQALMEVLCNEISNC
jgi:multimeric flavodoxin WrbA